MPTLEEYSERFKDFFYFKRENGILEVRMHTDGGPVHWSYQMHHAISELWTTIGHDTKNEVLIFTATDDLWIYKWDNDSFKEVEDSPDDDQRFNVQIYDTLKVVENFVNDIEIPTITAINGRGIHWEMAIQYLAGKISQAPFRVSFNYFKSPKGKTILAEQILHL